MPVSINAYTFDELTGAARERALKALPPADCDNTLTECMDSLRALCKVAGVKLHDWSIGPYSYSHSYIQVTFPNSPNWERDDAIGDLAGARAFAWIENNIFSPLRQPWNLRAKGRKYTRPGHVPAWPLTGVCFDEDLLSIFRDRNPRLSIEERFDKLADIIRRICEADIEYQEGDGREERAEFYYEDALFDANGHQLYTRRGDL